MPDFFSHVAVAYVVLQITAWRVRWLDTPLIVVGLAGALVPDAVKIGLLVPSYEVAAALGRPFSWSPLHRLGGAVVTAAIASLLVERDQRRVVFGLLVFGLLSHLALDALLARPGPYTYDMLYPLTDWPVPFLDLDLYLSSDYWPSVASGAAAAAVFALTRYTALGDD